MSAEGLAAVRAVYAALAVGDPGPLSQVIDPDIEWSEPEGAPVIAGVFRGRAAVFTEVFGRIPEVWAEFACEPQSFLDAGDHVIVTGLLRVQGLGTGRRADVPFVHDWTLRDGRAVAWRCHTDTAVLQAVRSSR